LPVTDLDAMYFPVRAIEALKYEALGVKIVLGEKRKVTNYRRKI